MTTKMAKVDSTPDFLPADWFSDEEAMNHRFQPFLKARDANPVGYDAKMKFWQQLIELYCEKQGVFMISANRLRDVFIRKNRRAQCLHTVLESMNASGAIRKLDDFQMGWLGRVWSLGTWAARSAMYYLPIYRPAPTPVDEKADIEQKSSTMYVHPKAFEERKKTLISRLNEVRVPQLTHFCIVEHERFEAVLTEMTKGCAASKSLLINSLKQEGKIYEFSINLQVSSAAANAESESAKGGVRVARFIKVLDATTRRVSPPNDDEINRLRNLSLQNVLTDEIAALERRISELNSQALRRKAAGDTKGALTCIAQRRRVETAIENKLAQRSTLQDVLARLEEAELNRSVLATLEQSNATFKKMQAEQSYTVDSVNNTMDETADVIRESEEIGTLLSTAARANADAALGDYSELESELDAILQESASPPQNEDTTAKIVAALPDTPKAEGASEKRQTVTSRSKEPRKLVLDN